MSIEKFRAELSNLAAIRDYLKEHGERQGFKHSSLEELILALDEAATNIIVHGYAGEPGWIEIELLRRDENLIVRILDRAPQFNPLEVPPPELNLPLEQRTPGGLGVFLMRQSVDEVRYRPRKSGGNELELIKRGFEPA